MVFTCDVSIAKAFPHFWEHSVGSCHATMALRADWQQQLTRCHKELGFRYVRFHGILSDDIGTIIDEAGTPVYSFFNADQICDFLLSTGMRPFIELSFMPGVLSSGSDTVFRYKGNVNPPGDYNKWATLVYELVSHWVQRYGIAEVSEWFFEVWNEPNLKMFWKGDQADYFKLYSYTVNAIKKVHKNLKTGGPATADNEWISEFRDFCEVHDVPVDFISTHHYPTDSFGKQGDDTITQLAQSTRSILRDRARKVKEQARGKPVYYTEWNTSSNPFDELHDMPYAAAFIVKTVMEATGLVEGYSYWTFTDIFEENYLSSVPFHGGFGLMNIYGIPKPAYRAFELLHRLGNELLTVEGRHETVDVWIVGKPGEINVMSTNWGVPRHAIKTETVKVRLNNIKQIKTSFIERIDDANANARSAWLEAGSPGSLTSRQVASLDLASSLVKKPFEISYEQGSVFIDVTLPPQGIAYITLKTE